ncbi:MAG: GDSL-type esterase/lipase family protein [Verrucomicrobiota bacterium]
MATESIVHVEGYSLVADKAELLHQNHPERLLLLGDSRIFRLPLPVKFGIDFGNVSIVNKGFGGGVKRASEAFVSEGVALKPVFVFVQTGINDVINDAPEIAVPRFQQFTKDFPAVVRKQGAEPILSTIIPVCRRQLFRHWKFLLYYPPHHRNWNQTVQIINTWLREYAATNGIRLVDLDLAFRNNSGRLREECFDGDGIHLSTEGNRLLWEQLATKIHSRAAVNKLPDVAGKAKK